MPMSIDYHQPVSITDHIYSPIASSKLIIDIDAGERSVTSLWRADKSMDYSHFESLPREVLALVANKMEELAQKYAKDLEEKLKSQMRDILESSLREISLGHSLDNPFSAHGTKEQSEIFTMDLHPQDAHDAFLHTDQEAQYVSLTSTLSLPVDIVRQDEGYSNFSVGVEALDSRRLTAEHQNASRARTRRESRPEYGNDKVRSPYAVSGPEEERKKASTTEEFWEQWINAGGDGDNAGSDYRQSYPSIVHQINGPLRTIDPRDVMRMLREE